MGVREKHRSVARHTHPDRALNPPPRPVPARRGPPVHGTPPQLTEPPGRAPLEP